MAAVPERRVGACVEVAAAQCLRERLQRAEIRVVALPFAGHGRMDRVVDVVVPLRGHAQTACVARGDQPGIVEVALGDQGQRPTGPCCQVVGFGRHLFEDVDRGRVDEGVHRIQAQAVGVEILHPPLRAIQDVAPDFVGLAVSDERLPLPFYRPASLDLVAYGESVLEVLIPRGVQLGEIIRGGRTVADWLSGTLPSEQEVAETADFSGAGVSAI